MARPEDQDLKSATQAAFRAAVKESIGVPSMVLAAGYLGFGALANGSAFPLWAALLSTLTIFALPGQLAMLEMAISGTAPLVIVITVSLTAARFLPMTVALLPTLRSKGRPPWRIYAAVHLLAMTGWAASMRRCPELPHEERLPWFVGFAFTNWVCCLVATAVGYALADSMPPLVRQGLVFVGPLYFVLILTGETRTRHGILALACGAAAGPLIYTVAPEWSVLFGGLVGGTVAYLVLRGRQRA